MNKASESELRIELVRLIRLQPKKKEEYPTHNTKRRRKKKLETWLLAGHRPLEAHYWLQATEYLLLTTTGLLTTATDD
jgi:hypothetical protein